MLAWQKTMLAWHKKKTHRRFEARLEALRRGCDDWTSRVQSFCEECKVNADNVLPEARRQSLLAAHAALQVEHQRFQAEIAEMRAPGQSRGATVTILMLTSVLLTGVQDKNLRRQRKIAAFQRILAQIKTSPTFYQDLLLWFVLPGGCIDEQIGDLNEEYLLQLSTEGEAAAKAWYREQVITSLKDCLWKRIERLAAVGTLIDLLDRCFRR
jgi:hypothetical protein